MPFGKCCCNGPTELHALSITANKAWSGYVGFDIPDYALALPWYSVGGIFGSNAVPFTQLAGAFGSNSPLATDTKYLKLTLHEEGYLHKGSILPPPDNEVHNVYDEVRIVDKETGAILTVTRSNTLGQSQTQTLTANGVVVSGSPDVTRPTRNATATITAISATGVSWEFLDASNPFSGSFTLSVPYTRQQCATDTANMFSGIDIASFEQRVTDFKNSQAHSFPNYQRGAFCHFSLQVQWSQFPKALVWQHGGSYPTLPATNAGIYEGSILDVATELNGTNYAIQIAPVSSKNIRNNGGCIFARYWITKDCGTALQATTTDALGNTTIHCGSGQLSGTESDAPLGGTFNTWGCFDYAVHVLGFQPGNLAPCVSNPAP